MSRLGGRGGAGHTAGPGGELRGQSSLSWRAGEHAPEGQGRVGPGNSHGHGQGHGHARAERAAPAP